MYTKRYVITIACHHQSDIVSCYGKRYEKRYVNDGDKRYRNDATTIDYFYRVILLLIIYIFIPHCLIVHRVNLPVILIVHINLFILNEYLGIM